MSWLVNVGTGVGVGDAYLLDSLLDAGVDRKKRFLGAPVELLNVVATEGVDHGGDGGRVTTAAVVEVEHAGWHGVGDRTTSDHGPDTAFWFQGGELEGGTGGGIELLDVGFFLGEITTERSGPDLVKLVRGERCDNCRQTYHWWSTVSVDLGRLSSSIVDSQVTSDSPLGATDALCGLFELGGHI